MRRTSKLKEKIKKRLEENAPAHAIRLKRREERKPRIRATYRRWMKEQRAYERMIQEHWKKT